MRIENKRGNWWFKDDICCEEGCRTKINDCDNEYPYSARGQRIRRCEPHYRWRSQNRWRKANGLDPHPDPNGRISATVIPFPRQELPEGITTASERKAQKAVSSIEYSPEGWVYVMVNRMTGHNLYKIGKTNNLKNRLREASTWGWFEIVHYKFFPDAKQAESLIHEVLNDFRLDARREWFEVSLETIKEMMEALGDYMVDPEYQKT